MAYWVCRPATDGYKTNARSRAQSMTRFLDDNERSKKAKDEKRRGMTRGPYSFIVGFGRGHVYRRQLRTGSP